MDVVTLLQRPPVLHRPVLIAAFRGWNDAGEAATGALEVIGKELGAEPFAEVDPEEYFDFQVARPTVEIVAGGSRAVRWPVNQLAWAALPGVRRHVVLLDGTEPNLRWRTFTNGLVAFAGELGITQIVTLGALQVDVPHTRPVPITGVAPSGSGGLGQRLGLRPSNYEGPTGITGVLNHAAAASGLQAMSMWAGVPHYLAGTAYLAAALALAERIAQLLEFDLPLGGLAKGAVAQRGEIGQLVEDDEDLAEYVTELEKRADEGAGLTDDLPGSPVSAEELAAEVERYLRDHHEG